MRNSTYLELSEADKNTKGKKRGSAEKWRFGIDRPSAGSNSPKSHGRTEVCSRSKTLTPLRVSLSNLT